MFEKEAEKYRKDLKSKFFLSEPQLDLACQGFKDGYSKCNERLIKANDSSYKDKPVVGFDEVMELGRMTIEEIKQKTSLCFLLNPNIPEEEKICVIEKVMATKATIVPKAALCNIITYILKQNAKLQEKLNIRSCQNCKHNNKSCPSDGSCVHYNKWEGYKNPQLTRAKEILEDIIKFQPYIDRDAMFLTCGNDWKEVIFKAEQFIKDSEVKK